MTTQLADVSLWESIRCTGLTRACGEIESLVEELPKRLAVFSYKNARSFLWVVFLGGTGTGKSTVFNAVCGKVLSETGVERPKTYGPVGYAHSGTPVEKGFPFAAMAVQRLRDDVPSMSPATGAPGQLTVFDHHREDLLHLALVDTPDLDSLELKNRQMVDDLYLIADVIIFITSQEKYADGVPFQFLERIERDGKPCFLLLNKSQQVLTREEVLTALRGQGLHLGQDRLWLLPYYSRGPVEHLAKDSQLADFKAALSTLLTPGRVPEHLRNERRRGARELEGITGELLGLLDSERQAAAAWLGHLDLFFKDACENLFEQQEKQFSDDTREFLQAHHLPSRVDPVPVDGSRGRQTAGDPQGGHREDTPAGGPHAHSVNH